MPRVTILVCSRELGISGGTWRAWNGAEPEAGRGERKMLPQVSEGQQQAQSLMTQLGAKRHSPGAQGGTRAEVSQRAPVPGTSPLPKHHC